MGICKFSKESHNNYFIVKVGISADNPHWLKRSKAMPSDRDKTLHICQYANIFATFGFHGSDVHSHGYKSTQRLTIQSYQSSTFNIIK